VESEELVSQKGEEEKRCGVASDRHAKRGWLQESRDAEQDWVVKGAVEGRGEEERQNEREIGGVSIERGDEAEKGRRKKQWIRAINFFLEMKTARAMGKGTHITCGPQKILEVRFFLFKQPDHLLMVLI
jgi:hypothetical protein